MIDLTELQALQNHEMNIDTASDRSWYRFVAKVEKLAGLDTLDGNQATDGYSLDAAYDAWKAGKTAEQHAASILGWAPAP